MIFLDANAFYSYFGRYKLNMYSSPVDEKKLSEYLDRRNDKSLPTSVFIEIITRFRNDLKLLKELLEFRYKKGLPLYNNIPDYIISEDEITCVSLMNEDHLKIYANRILSRKIEIESKFTLLFFEITKNLYTHYKLESVNEFSQYDRNSILDYIGRKGFKEYGKILEDKIKKELGSGYDDKKEQNVLKSFYIQELNDACVMIDVIIAGCIACKDEESDIISIIQQAYQKDIDLGMDGQNGTMSCIVDTLVKNQCFLDSAKLRISEMFKEKGYSHTQRSYLKDEMFTSWFERGQKLRKNDIFDMFFVGCLDYVDTRKKDCILIDLSSYILTFDSKIKTYLKTVKPQNLKIIESI